MQSWMPCGTAHLQGLQLEELLSGPGTVCERLLPPAWLRGPNPFQTRSEPFSFFSFRYRMDDMAVDSDEEVDYSKMDQVCHHQLLGPASELGIGAGWEDPTGEKRGCAVGLGVECVLGFTDLPHAGVWAGSAVPGSKPCARLALDREVLGRCAGLSQLPLPRSPLPGASRGGDLRARVRLGAQTR